MGNQEIRYGEFDDRDNHGRSPIRRRCHRLPLLAHALCPLFDTEIRTRAELRPDLVAYRDRMMKQYFSDPRCAAVAA
jgi:hypothetical protein